MIVDTPTQIPTCSIFGLFLLLYPSLSLSLSILVSSLLIRDYLVWAATHYYNMMEAWLQEKVLAQVSLVQGLRVEHFVGDCTPGPSPGPQLLFS